MRIPMILLATTLLTACSGEGPTTVGGNAVATGSGTTVGTTTTVDPYAEFVTPTKAKTYYGIGGAQVFDYNTDDRLCCQQQAQTFAGHTSTARDSIIQISYDPREATFTLIVNDPLSGAATTTRFQDPGSRTNFGGAKEPQWGTSNLSNPNLRYLQAGDGNPLSPFDHSGTGAVNPGNNTTPPDGLTGSSYQSTTLFYEAPGSNTKYVGLAGFLRNSLSWKDIQVGNGITRSTNWHLERGAFAYGLTTDNSAVPTLGSASYNGDLIGTMVFNPSFDGAYPSADPAILPTYFQWLEGTAKTTVDFAKNTVALALSATTFGPIQDRYSFPTHPDRSPYPTAALSSVGAGVTFIAAGKGSIDLIHNGGFFGSFQSASFGSTRDGSPTALNIAGSSFDGAFYGPKANEIGGGFHIAGGTPDQRIDILGGFTGK